MSEENINGRIFRLIGRGKVARVSVSKKVQQIQIDGLKGETVTDIERMQEYGLETYPKTASETTILYINGNRDQGLVICVQDRRNKPTLQEGEVQLYNAFSCMLYLKKDGTIRFEDQAGNFIKSTTTQWNINDNFTVDK